MSTLAELWETVTPTQPSVKEAPTRIAPNVQAQRDQGALAILQNELKASQDRFASATDPQAKARHQADIAGLQREIGRMSKTAAPATSAPQATLSVTPAPAAPAADSTNFADIWQSMTAEPTQTSTAGAGRGTYQGYSAADEAANKTQQPVSNVRQIVGKVLQKGFEARQQLGERTAGVIDTLYEALPATYGAVQQAIVRPFTTPEKAEKLGKQAGQFMFPSQPLGKVLGITGKEAYQKPLGGVTEPIAEQVNKMFNVLGMTPEQISEKTGIPAPDIRNMVVIGSAALPQALKETGQVVSKVTEAAKQTKVGQQLTQAAKELELVRPNQAPTPTPQSGMVSAGAAVVPDATTIKQALSVATPELQQAISAIPIDKVNIPTLLRHIEADSLPKPMRLTEGMATGDIVKLSNEQNRRGKDPELAFRINQLNNDLIENIGLIREKAAPDVYGSKTIENSQGIIDAYKSMDANLSKEINTKYQNLRDAAGGQFPVDAPQLLKNIQAKLKKELLSNEAPSGQFSELQQLAKNNSMTFEDYLSLRRNLGDVARTSKDGPTRKAAGYMIEELEKLPLQESAKRLKPLADEARKAARDRFQMLEKDPAFKAAVEDSIPADKFIDKFVIGGVNKNINTMVQNLGKDSPAHQHMAAGTVNWLKDKAGIIDETGNFSQAGYNKALKKLDDVKNLQEIFNPEAASQLKTLGNVARYTQAQPRGAFVNNSNTLVGAMAEKAAGLTKAGIEGGLNLAVPGLQLGTSVMEMRARRAAEAETRKALETGAGTKQTGKNKIQDLGK